MAKPTRPLNVEGSSLLKCLQTGARLLQYARLYGQQQRHQIQNLSNSYISHRSAVCISNLPEFPTAGGSGTDAQTVDFTFKVASKEVTETFS
jgi:hypothetical protein